MKKLSKLKLNMLSETNLKNREMNRLRGGEFCTCSCYYVNNGGSSSNDNMTANYSNGNGTVSINGCNQYMLMDGRLIPCDNCDENNHNYGIGPAF